MRAAKRAPSASAYAVVEVMSHMTHLLSSGKDHAHSGQGTLRVGQGARKGDRPHWSVVLFSWRAVRYCSNTQMAFRSSMVTSGSRIKSTSLYSSALSDMF